MGRERRDLVRLLCAKGIEVWWEGFSGFEKGSVELSFVTMVGIKLWLRQRRGSKLWRTGVRWGINRGGREAATSGRNRALVK